MATSQFTLRTRAEAKTLGAKKYFTGKPCKSGHVAERYTQNGSCFECLRISVAIRNGRDPFALAKKREPAAPKDPWLAERRLRRAGDKARRAEAIASGADLYVSEMPCIYGHVGMRIAKSYGCHACHVMSLKPEPDAVRQKRAAAKEAKRARAEQKRRSKANRAAAIDAGETQYLGAVCRNGHDGRRWTASFACVSCFRAEEAKSMKREYDIAYRASLPIGTVSARAKAWAKANPEKRKAILFGYDARRRMQKAEGDSAADVLRWEQAAKKVCYWCNAKCAKKYHIDHYEPLSKGGKHEVRNLVIACPSCNLRKNAKDPYEFAKERGRLF